MFPTRQDLKRLNVLELRYMLATAHEVVEEAWPKDYPGKAWILQYLIKQISSELLARGIEL